MRSLKMYMPSAAALVAVALAATSAPAANWDPANTNLAGTSTWLFTTNGVGSTDCKITITMRSTGNDLATSTAPPVFDNCSSNIQNPTTVTSSSNWALTATTTTFVDLALSFTIAQANGVCVITVAAALPNNTWNNTTHALSLNSAQNFPITEHGFCDGGTTGHVSGDVVFPASTIIT